MLKMKYNSRVSFRGGKIVHSVIDSPEDSGELIKLMKPLMNRWLKSKELQDADVFVVGKYYETNTGVTTEFKIRSLNVVAVPSKSA